MSRIVSFFRRNSVSIGIGVIAFCIVAILLLQAVTIGSLSSEIQAQNKLLTQISKISQDQAKNAQQRSDQIQGVDKHMDCIVKFFSQPDRTNKAINDIETCRITGIYDNQPTNTTKPSSSNTTEPRKTKPSKADTTKNSDNSPSNPISKLLSLIKGAL